MNGMIRLLFVTVFAVPVLSQRSIGWKTCRKNNPDYTFPQRGWEVVGSSKDEHPYIVAVSLRRQEDNTHCHWCSGVIVGAQHVLVVNCGRTTVAPSGNMLIAPQPMYLMPHHFLVYDEIDISRNKSLWNAYDEEAENSIQVTGSYYFPYQPEKPYLLSGYAHLLLLAERFKFDKTTQCLPVSKFNFNPPPISKVKFLQWCYHSKSRDVPHNWKTYTLHKVFAERDCKKWGMEDKPGNQGLAQSCISVDERRPNLNMDFTCQRTFGNIITYNGTYSFSIDYRHNEDDPKEPIIDRYPIYYFKSSSQFMQRLKWHMGSDACYRNNN